MKLNGSDIIMECLIEQGVDSVFGYPGGAVLNIYDAIYKYKDKITHYLTSHEQGASHAADGYARATGKVGVCIATSGPGATNLVTGIATAYMDSVPMVAITGNVGKSLLGKDSFQEVDITGVTLPITKHNFIVKDISELAETLRKAFYLAKEGRSGPVLVDITKDVTANFHEYEKKAVKEIAPIVDTIKDRSIEEAIELINSSKKPLIFAGGGVINSNSSTELLEFSEKIDSPVTLTVMGLGGFPSSNKRYTGMIGMHGTKISNLSALQCDLLISIGVRFSDRVTSNISDFVPNAKILHIDIDPAEINKNAISYSSVIGDMKEILKILNQRLSPLNHSDWMKEVYELKERYTLQYPDDNILRPQFIIEKISELTKGEAIITTDVGQHQMWACQYIKHEKPRHFITSGGLGTMGFGLGASIGASIGNPGKTVINITGDGCFRMNNIELGTAVEYDVPVIIAIINNHALGMVRQWQNLFYDKRYSATTLDKTTDFAKLAEAYKATAFNVTKPEEVEKTLKKALELKKTVVINFEVSDDNKVFPMVAAGSKIDDFVEEG